MSPNQQQSASTEFSPWTEAFQASPLHQDGNYEAQPAQDDAQAPTWHALSAIYDPTER